MRVDLNGSYRQVYGSGRLEKAIDGLVTRLRNDP
jgi:hypothetical protein